MELSLSFKTRLLVLAALIIAVFGSSLNSPYQFDDKHSIPENISVRSLSNIPKFWSDPSISSFGIENRNYRPLTFSFFTVCWVLGGGSPIPFHIFKLVLHFLMMVFAYLIWEKLWAFPGWLVGKGTKINIPLSKSVVELSSSNTAFVLVLLFSIHPACAEIVNYIVATSSLQCSVFYAAAYYFYLLGRENQKLTRSTLWSLFFYFLSVASKEEGITLPAVVVLTELFLSNGPIVLRIKAAVLNSWKYWASALVLSVWIYVMHPVEGNLSRGNMSWFVYFMTQWKGYLWYLKLLFWPWDLNADYVSFLYIWSFKDPQAIQALLGNLLILGFAWGLRRSFPAILFGLLWFYITISPTSSVVVLGEPINEHRMYLGYVGLLGAGYGVIFGLSRGAFGETWVVRYFGKTVLVCLALLAVGSVLRTQVWRSEKALWEDTVAKNPTSGRALNNLALVLASEGNVEKAIGLLDQCEKVWSSYMFCAVNKGWAYTILLEQSRALKGGQGYSELLTQARTAFEHAIRYNGNSVYANFQMGRFQKDFLGDCKTAAEYLKKAIDLNGDRYPTGQGLLASCYVEMNRLPEAQELVSKARIEENSNDIVLAALGDVERAKGNFDQALKYYEKLISKFPRFELGFRRAAYLEISREHYLAAVQYLIKWLAVSPGSSELLVNLTIAARRTGELSALPELKKRYLASNPQHSEKSFADDLLRMEHAHWPR